MFWLARWLRCAGCGGCIDCTVQQQLRFGIGLWFGIGLQYALTLLLAHSMHYMLANIIAIVLASVSNFLANDRWTFRQRPDPGPTP